MSTILLVSPEPWDGHFVSKHHYALELARRGNNVFFHGPPESSGGIRLEPVPETLGRLWVLHSPKVAAGLRFMPGALRRFLEARWLGLVEKIAGKPIDVVWNFENSRFFDMGFAGERLKIYQQMDLNQTYQPAIAAATADLSIAISAPIEQRLADSAQNLIRITHGHTNQDIAQPAPAGIDQVFGSAAVNAVLIGNLDIAYLDVPLLVQLVTTHPAVRFHFVGAYRAGHGLHVAIGAAPNAVFWGRQSFDLLPCFLNRADVLLVAYLADKHLDQLANPHKIMEYLASGRCILATRTLEYEDQPDLIEIAMDRADYAKRFASIAANPAAWNSAEQVAHRQAFAFENTYPRQLDRIVHALGPHGTLIS
jgi:glycosyltransferase involved in cell wall biosynthesis